MIKRRGVQSIVFVCEGREKMWRGLRQDEDGKKRMTVGELYVDVPVQHK
jgi:hypothetical protein